MSSVFHLAQSFEGVDANAKLMALSGKKGIEIKGVKDEEHQRTENKSAGGSVGVFVGTNGNSYGIGIEGSVNVAKGKSNSDSERWQNSHLQADKLITNSEAGNLSLDAANLNAKRWEADIQNLTVTSRQDTEKYESKQTSASASGSVAQGSGGGASVSASYNKAKVDYAQVNEQAGIRVGEDGMDAHIHNHTQLNGAIIESDADASKNHFKTKSLTHTDIENRSEIKTESASMSAGSGGVNPMQALSSALSLLGNTNESARSTTQSAISDNIQIDTETPEKLTALSRDTKNANQRVEKQDLQKVQERQEMAKVIGDITNNAISIATYNEREKINKLSLEKFKAEEKYGKESTQAQEIGKQITAIQNDIDRTYGIGSEKGMAIRAVTAALQAAAQNDTAGSLVALASPYLNQKIHEMTAGDTAKDKATNLMAHALLSAVEFQVTGKDPLTGAIAGVTGEATAEIIARAYGKPVSELTANEKENISTLSQLAGGLAAALTAKANGSTTEQGGNFLAATAGAETAKRAVENNFFVQAYKSSDYANDLLANEKAKQNIEQIKQDVTKVLREEHPIIAMVGDGVYAVGSATGEVIYVSREILVQVAPMILAPQIAGALKVGQAIKLAAKYPKTTETIIAGGISTGFDVYNGEVSYEKTLANFALAGIKAGKSTSQQLSIDAIYNGLTLVNDKTKSNEDIGWEGLGKLAGTVASITSDVILMKQGVNPITRQIISNFTSGYTENQVKESRSSLNNKEQSKESK